MKPSRIVLLVVVLALIALFFAFDLQQFFTLDFARAQRTAIDGFQARNPALLLIGFFLLYVVVMALALPVAALLTLAAGALFGLWTGVLIVSFASTIGATLAFLFARYLFRDAVRARFARQLEAIDRGVARDGAFYLFAMRLVPAFPPATINLAMSVTPIRTWTFYWVSQLGMLAGTLVYVNAGLQLWQLDSLSGLVSPVFVASFALLGILPLLAKKAIDAYKGRVALRRFKKPRRFDTNMVVIGAGSGGLVAALIAATVKAKVTLVERHRMGGDCLNTGCVPSKSLLRSAKILSYVARAEEFGFKSASAEFDFADVMERVQRIIKKIEPNDSVERYTGLGVDCVMGDATIVSPYRVRVGEREIATRSIVLATGGAPFVPPIPGLEEAGYVTSDTVWELRELPRRFVVLGGGPIGCELAQAFRRFGAEVVQVERNPHLLMREDADVVDLMQSQFAAEGIRVLASHEARRVEVANGEKRLICAGADGQETAVAFDEILVAVGRAPNTAGLGLEEVGVALDERGAVEVDDYLRTSVPTIYALRRRDRPLPVHPHRLAPSVVRGGESAVQPLQALQGGLPGDPLDDLHGPGSGAGGAERAAGRAPGRASGSDPLPPRRAGPRAGGRRGPRLRQGADAAGQGSHPRRHHRRPPRWRPDGRVHLRHEVGARLEEGDGHHPHLSNPRRGQQVRRQHLAQEARPGRPARLGGALPSVAPLTERRGSSRRAWLPTAAAPSPAATAGSRGSAGCRRRTKASPTCRRS